MTPTPVLSSAFLLLALLGMVGCVDVPAGGGTSGTAAYVYDNVTGNLLAWDDVNTLYASPAAPPHPAHTPQAGSVESCCCIVCSEMFYS